MTNIKKCLFSGIITLSVIQGVIAQTFRLEVPPLPNEKWWGGLVALGNQMPFSSTTAHYDLSRNNMNNQVVPLMLSSAGRYIWSEQPFRFCMKNDTLKISSDYELPQIINAGKNLKDAYRAAAQKHFPPSGKLPAELFFSKPQYNTWIELMYDQNQEDILDYADKIIANRFPTGVFMIDDNWQKYYGNFDFKPDKFPDPAGMIRKLHAQGFKVMVWVCPFVSADSPEFRELQAKGYLLKQKGSHQPAIINWWNGMSACYDVTNPKAVEFLKKQLKEAQAKYGIDGFKFDAGDVGYMTGQYHFYDPQANTSTFSEKWAAIGLDFPYNELRTSFKLGGQELVQRLGDKNYSWKAVSLLIPDIVAAGLLGHFYTCPDMIGGGQFGAFLNIDPDKFDQELIVRSCQVHAMMPMMQFSVAPWRILDSLHLDICRKYAHLHEQMGAYILQVAHESSQTGEPVIRHMEYAFPHQGFVNCKDQFMLGDKYLVAPMITRGSSRTVQLPAGLWQDDQGKRFRGPKTINITVPIERLPYYKRIK